MFTPRTWKTAITALTCCLLHCVLFSLVITLQFAIYLVRFSCSFNHTFNQIVHLHSISVITKPTTHNKNSSKHSILHSPVVDVCKCRKKKEVAVGRFRDPAAGANATRKMAQGRNWFSMNYPVPRTNFLELRGAKVYNMTT